MVEPLRQRSLFRHPLAAVGGAFFMAGGFLFLTLLLIDVTGGEENPYRALGTFIAAPFIVTLGIVLFLISMWIQIRTARKKGESVAFRLSIDPTDPAYLRNLWLFLGLCAVLILVVGYSGTRAYEATDSVGLCGETCHTCSGRQGHSPADGSSAVSIARFRHVAIPQFLRVISGSLRGVKGPAALWMGAKPM